MHLSVIGKPIGQAQWIVSKQTVTQIVEQFDHSPGPRHAPRRAGHAGPEARRARQVHARCELDEDGQYRGLAALKCVPAALFSAFRLGKWLRRERDKARLRLQRKQAAYARSTRTEQQAAQDSLIVAGLLDKVRRRPAQRATPAAAASTDPTREAQHAEQEKQLQLYATRLYAREPERGRDWAYDQARRHLAEQGELV
ncbi:hypothetical protein [Cupriavidus necator]